ncbi:MAG TPA: hypothetical protein PKK96_09715 [Anaerolineales bacterium]|nr:hypothetical protein [Anaerolineales bacterium]HNQ94422.1 hypothetical protein [Anaerolineales bacterium]HNS61269.1 hypothetical protein [Anaerolineales bacterium]
MKKVLGKAAGILFAAFGIAILGLLMSLTFGALGKLFPDNFTNQVWGLVLFDIAAMIWGLTFVFKCESTMQYAVAAIGFVAAFVGTLGMVAVEVLLSGQEYVEVQSWVGQWMVYGFIIVTAIHAALLYAHHASAPDIHEKINVGIARGEIMTAAITQATNRLEVEKESLARSLHDGIVAQVKRDLGISTSNHVLDLPALPVNESMPYPVTFAKETISPSLSWDWLRSKFPKAKTNTPAPITEDQPASGVPFRGEKDDPA